MKKKVLTSGVKKKVLTVVIYATALIVVLAGWIIWSNHSFEETFYTINSPKIDDPVRLVLLTDMHQVEFGSDNRDLIGRIKELKPDVVLLAGDVVNKNGTDWSYALNLCGELIKIAPVYYGMGNHENEALYGQDLNKEFLDGAADVLGDSLEDFTPLLLDPEVWNALEDTGACLLQNESVTVDINGNSIKIGALSTNISSFWPYSGQFIYSYAQQDSDVFKILISHRPEPVMQYISDYSIDLVVSGHNHGGIIRIPGVGGLMSNEEGFFPTYDQGTFINDSMTLLISRGLGGHGLVPRVFNKPELVVLDIH